MDTAKQSATKDSPPRRTIRFSAKANGPTLDEQLQKVGVSTRRFGHWTALSHRPFEDRSQVKVRCRCDCGRESDVVLVWLVDGRSTRCKACAGQAFARRRGRFVAETPADKRLQKRVNAMRQRCCNPANQSYANYGGRGIEFRFASIKEGAEWVREHLPHPTYLRVEIDRIDNNGHYEPGNLRLATRRQNALNTRTAVKVEWRGRRVPLLEWAENPYSITASGRMVAKGLTGEQIIAQAWQSVAEKRKGWRTMEARLLSMTSSTAARETDS